MSDDSGVDIGILHPGAMGSSVAAAAISAGNRVWWCSSGRSRASAERAESAGLRSCTTLEDMLEQCDVIISVCPPANAVEVASAVAGAARSTGFEGVFVDANAISQATAAAVAEQFGSDDLEGRVLVVDGGIVGPPAWKPGTTRLFLAGERSGEIASLFDDTALGTVVMGARNDGRNDVAGGGYGSASALKMAYAAWTKGSSALLAAVGEYAEAAGVADELVSEWNLSQPGLADRLQGTLELVGPKAWRFVAEMHEIADSLASEGLPDGYHRAAAATYEAMAARVESQER